ncbi:ATP synthase subunit I [Streptomyces winkii]|uniref:ATP synthase subunit I n=1 Tax=Streptomyces winkii TaxID=3051178 RepID=UPI0028D769C4|nr:hypothetical protein [Streptomyces sp. DSM 40971]
MSVHRPASGSTARTAGPSAPAGCPYEPRTPEGADAWDTRSRALVDGARDRADSGGGRRAGNAERAGQAGQRSGGADGARAGRGRPGPRPVAHPSRPADPVRELMHRHRELCERAVDPLEIAATLEAHGVTDRVAARFRHRDVFSLAEELFARVPRAEEPGPDTASASASAGASRAGRQAPNPARPAAGCAAPPRVLLPLLAVLPGVAVAAAVAVFASSGAGAGPGAGGVLAAAFGLGAGLVCALVPAVWCARWFAVRARRRLEHSRSLAEFAAGTRPLLTAAVVLFAVALTGLHLVSREIAVFAGVRGLPAGAPRGGAAAAELAACVLALGVLLFAALLLRMHGFRGTAAAGLVAACALQAAAATAASAAGSAVAGGPRPPDDDAGLYAAAACGFAALLLLACAYRLLGGASAHRPRDVTARSEPPGDDGTGGTGGTGGIHGAGGPAGSGGTSGVRGLGGRIGRIPRPRRRESRTDREQCQTCEQCEHCERPGGGTAL